LSTSNSKRSSIVAGVFITFEGIDGSGKSTQMELLAQYLRSRDLPVLTTREPGGTPLGVRLREALLQTGEHVDPLAELLLYAADRAQHVRSVLRPALEEGKIVLSDRYADATVAYQGAGRGFSRKVIESVVRLATEGLKPALTLLFDLPVEECLARTRRRGVEGRDRLDSEEAEFHMKVRERYLEIAATEPNRVKIIYADGTLNQTHAKVLDVVIPFLQMQKRSSTR
jgi:dTMP kinase